MKIFYSFGLLICPWPSPLSGRGGRVERVFVVRTVPSFEWRRVLYVQLYEWLYVEKKKKKNSWSKKNHENPISSSEREVSRWYPWWQSFPKMYFTLLVKKKKEKKNKKKKRKSEKFFSFRQTFEVAFPFRISLSYSRSST